MIHRNRPAVVGAYHRTRAAVERGRRKEADLVTAGLRVLRSAWRQVEREPDRIGLMLRVALMVWLIAAACRQQRTDAHRAHDERSGRHAA
jgi:hypothetical protein